MEDVRQYRGYVLAAHRPRKSDKRAIRCDHIMFNFARSHDDPYIAGFASVAGLIDYMFKLLDDAFHGLASSRAYIAAQETQHFFYPTDLSVCYDGLLIERKLQLFRSAGPDHLRNGLF